MRVPTGLRAVVSWGVRTASVLSMAWIATQPNVAFGQTPEEDRNFTGLASLSDTYVVQASTTANYADLYEHTPAEGTIEHFSPSGMFTDTSILWLERLRINNDTSDQSMAIHLHRGGSSVAWDTDVCPLFDGADQNADTSDDWALYLITPDDEEYVVWYANATRGIGNCGGGFVNFDVDDLTVVRSETGSSSVMEFVRALTDSRVIVAVSANNSYTPTFVDAPTLSASLQSGVTSFSWTDIAGAQANDWIIQWRPSYTSSWTALSTFDTPTQNGNGDWISTTTFTQPGILVYYSVRLGVGARSNEVQVDYPDALPPPPPPPPDPSAPTATRVPGAVGREGNSAAAVVMMPRVENQMTFWVLLSVVAAASVAIGTRRFNIPHGGEITVVATVLPLAVGGIRGAVDPVITLLALLFGGALLIILMRIQR